MISLQLNHHLSDLGRVDLAILLSALFCQSKCVSLAQKAKIVETRKFHSSDTTQPWSKRRLIGGSPINVVKYVTIVNQHTYF